MAGGIVGVEPLDLPGAYRAKMADGSSMMVHGPAGEELARRYANTGMNATGPNAVASNDAGDAASTIGKIGKGLLYTNPLTAPLAATYDAGKKLFGGSDAPPPERMGQTVAAAQQPQPETQNASAAPTAAAPAAPAPPQAGPLGYSMKGIDANGKEIAGPAIRREDGSIGIYVAPVAGRAGGLTQLGKQEIQQTADANKEEARQLALAEISRQRGVDAALDESAEREGFIIEQQKQNINAAKAQQDEINKQTAAVDKLQAGYQAARDDFMNSKVDPDQYMKSNTARGIFSAIGVMLNQFGSAFTHQPNVAAEFVNSQIDRNIRAQETQINVKGKAADNMLADLTRQTGDMKLAKMTMKELLTERAMLESQRVGMGAKNQAVKAGASEVAARLAAQKVQQEKDRNIAQTEHVLSNPLTYRQGVAGRSGGFVQPTQESYEKGAENARQNEELRLRQEKEAAAAGKAPHIGQRQQAQIISARVAQGAVQEYADALGVQRGKNGEYSDPTLSAAVGAKIPLSDTKQKVDALKNTLVAEIGKAQIGGVLSEGEAHTMQQQIDEARTPGQIGAMLRHYDKTMKHVEGTVREVAASSGPGSDNEPDDSRR